MKLCATLHSERIRGALLWGLGLLVGGLGFGFGVEGRGSDLF